MCRMHQNFLPDIQHFNTSVPVEILDQLRHILAPQSETVARLILSKQADLPEGLEPGQSQESAQAVGLDGGSRESVPTPQDWVSR